MQITAPQPTGTFAADRLAPFLAALARTPGSDRIHLTTGGPSLAQLATNQQLFDVVRSPEHAWHVRPLNAASRDALSGTSGQAIRNRIAGTRAKLETDFPGAVGLDSVALTVGARPVQFRWGRAIGTRDSLLGSSHAAEGQALPDRRGAVVRRVPEATLEELRQPDATIPEDWRDDLVSSMRDFMRSGGYWSSRVVGNGAEQMILGGWDAAQLRTPVDPKALHALADAANAIGLIGHEAMHTVSPSAFVDDATWRRTQWLEEGGANTLDEWAGQFGSWAAALGVPDPGPSSPQTEHEYYPMQVAVARVLALAGFDERRPSDFAGGSALLQGGPVEDAAQRIAAAIAQRHRLDAATRTRIERLIDGSRGDAKVIDEVERIVTRGQVS